MTSSAKAIVLSASELPGILRTLKVRPIVYFVASNDISNKPWCSDCIKSDPIIENVFGSPARVDWGLVRVFVGSKEEWTSSNNEFRQIYGIKNIPTLAKWTETGISKDVLVESDLFDQTKIENYLDN